MNVRAEVEAAIRKVFPRYGGAVTDALTAPEVPGWDSFTHVQLMLEIEQRTGREIDIPETYGLTNIGDLIGYVRTLGGPPVGLVDSGDAARSPATSRTDGPRMSDTNDEARKARVLEERIKARQEARRAERRQQRQQARLAERKNQPGEGASSAQDKG
jgi:acyl carrier protein